MAKVPVKLIKLQKDKPSTRLRFLEDKVERLHSPKKVWKNPDGLCQLMARSLNFRK